MERSRHDALPVRVCDHRLHGHFHMHVGHVMPSSTVTGRHTPIGCFIGPDPQGAGPQRDDGPDQQHDAHHRQGAAAVWR